MKPVCQHLLKSYYTNQQLVHPTSSFEAVQSIWIAVRKLSENIAVLASESSYGLAKKNPVYRFHFDVFPFYSSDNDARIRYRESYNSLASFLHQRANHWLRKPTKTNEKYKSNLGLVCVKAVHGFMYSHVKSGFRLSKVERGLLPVKLSHVTTVSGEKLLSTGNMSFVKDLFIRDERGTETRGKHHKDFKGRIKRWFPMPFPPAVSVPTESYHFNRNGPFIANSEDDANEPSIFNFYTNEADNNNPEDATVTTIAAPPEWSLTGWEQRRKNVGRIESAVQVYHIQPWSNRCLSLSTLKLIHWHIVENEALASETKFIILMTLLLGLSDKALLDTHPMKLPTTVDDDDIDMEAIAANKTWLDVDLEILWSVSQQSSEATSGYYFVDDFHEVKLPPCICNVLRDIKHKLHPIGKADIKATNRFLKSLPSDGLMGISISRLSQTYRAFFINGAGLPNIYGDFIRGRQTANLLSQHAYLTVPEAYLIPEWHRMCAAFLQGISSYVSLPIILSNMHFKPMSLENISEYENTKFMGSALTPKISIIKNHLKNLYDKFPHSHEALIAADDKTWNCYMAYVYLFYALTTGQRPNRSPMPMQNLINTNLRIAYISDKNNRYYKEHRQIPLCPPLIKVLCTHQQISKQWLTRKRMQGYGIEGDLDSFFVADTKRKILLPVSPNKLDAMLDNPPPPYFSGISNGCRHLLLTTLNWLGTPQDHIDYISGHRHVGFEPTHICSPTSSKRIGEYLSQVIESSIVPLYNLKQPVWDNKHD